VTMAADPVFVDTNVLIYATRRTASEHAAALAALARLEGEGRALWISLQILREYLAAVTRPQATSPALPMTTAIADVRRFQQVFYVAEDRLAVLKLDRLLALLGAHLGAGRQVHDTNIVATMLEHGIRRLLTFNAGDFRRFAGIIELEPTQ
jgi:predicted nucleic acid-binding protein